MAEEGDEDRDTEPAPDAAWNADEDLERRLNAQGRRPSDATLEELDALWEEAKTLAPPPRAGGETR